MGHDAAVGQYTDRSATAGSTGLPAHPMSDAKLPLPGMAAIALWMLALSVLGVVGVLTQRYPTPVLALCTVFAAAGLGMIQRRRWGWALTLGAVFCSMCFGCYMLFRFRQAPGG